MAYNLTFNSYSLQDSSYRTKVVQHTNTPIRNIQAESRARADGLTIVNTKYVSRDIVVEGQLTAATRDALVQKIDEMKKKLANDASGTLDIDYGNSTRRYFATVQKLEIPEDFYNITAVPYTVYFFCADPFGYATSSGIVNLTSKTDLLLDTVLTVSGSVNSDPVLIFTVNSASGFSLLTFSNETTGESIIVNKPAGADFSAADQVIINCQTKQVHINASGLDYTGRFPSIAPETARLRVALSATSANYDAKYQYAPRFL